MSFTIQSIPLETVAAARILGEGFRLGDRDMTVLLLATWFHDSGYTDGPEEHEERSCGHAERFLTGKVSEDELNDIKACIRATPCTTETFLRAGTDYLRCRSESPRYADILGQEQQAPAGVCTHQRLS
jgi:hypothetical protein